MVTLRSIGLSAVFVAAATLATTPAATAAESVPIRVEFDAPNGCSSVDAFYAGLLTRMSRARRAVAGEEAVHLSVRLTRIGPKVRGDLRLMDGPGDGDTRRVEGESCESVVEVLSLTAALALTAQPPRVTPPPAPPPTRASPAPSRSSAAAAAPSSSSSPASSESTEATSKPPETPPDVAKPPPDADKTPVLVKPPVAPSESVRRTGFHLGVQAVAADVIAGSVNLGGGIAARLERHINDGPGASIALAFVYVPNDLVQSPDQIAVRWMALAATGCPPWSLGRTFTLQACAQAIGGWLTATGRGITNPTSVGRTWWSAGALLRAGAQLGAGYALELEAGATIPLVQHRFVTTTPERTVGETPTVAPFVALGLSRSL